MQGSKGKGTPPGSGDELLVELSPDLLYDEAARLFRERRYGECRERLGQYIALRPSDAAARYLVARAMFQEGSGLDEAAEHLKEAVRLDPGSTTNYLSTLGLIYLQQGDAAKAEEVFSYALSVDKGENPRHTYALEFYLNLSRKKNKTKAKAHAGPKDDKDKTAASVKGMPAFLATDIDRWREARRQPYFLLPSILVHLLLLLLVSHLSSISLPFERPFQEDFVFIDVAQQEAAVPEEAAPAEPSREAAQPAPGVQDARPAPVTPRKGESISGPEREAAKATAPGRPDVEKAPEQGALGQKARSKIEGGQSAAGEMTAKLSGAVKEVDIKHAAPKTSAGEVDLKRGGLGDISAGERARASKEVSVGSVSERSESPSGPKAGAEGIFMGAQAGGEAGKWAKGKTSGLRGEDSPRSAGGAVSTGGEKEMTLGVPERGKTPGSESGPDSGVFMARKLDISAGPSSKPSGSEGGGVAGFKSVDKDKSALAGAGEGLGSGAGESTGPEKGHGTRKQMASLGGTDASGGPAAGRPGAARSGKGPGLDIDRPDTAKRFADAGRLPGARKLELSGGAQSSGGTAPGGTSRGRESLGSLEDKGIRSAPSPFAGAAGTLPGDESPGRGGAMAGAPSGKAPGRGALSGGVEGPGEERGGLFARLADKVTDALGIGRPEGGAGSGAGGAAVRRGGDLSGLAEEATGGGGLGAEGSGRGGRELKLGTSERSERAGPAGVPSGSPSGEKRGGAVGGKKMAEGALGVPGGRGEERYASATRGEVSPSSTEKEDALQSGRKGTGRALLGPGVKIVSPGPGKTRKVTQTVKGFVSDARTTKAILTINNESRVISVENGSFESVISLGKGRNVITVTAFDLDGNMGKDSVALDYSRPSGSIPVNITTPRNGQVIDVSERSIITVKGTMGDQDIKKAKLVLNGNPMDIVVNRGYFEQDVALVQERNTILVEAVNSDDDVAQSETVTVTTMNVASKDIMIIMTWDKPRADMDLHVYGPMGGHTYYKNPNIYESQNAIAGAQLEQDAKGNFGPEVFTQAKADKGVYSIKSNYFFSGGDGDSYSTVTVVLYGDNPSRRMVRVFGPHLQVDTKTGEDTWEVAKFKMPEGIFLED